MNHIKVFPVGRYILDFALYLGAGVYGGGPHGFVFEKKSQLVVGGGCCRLPEKHVFSWYGECRVKSRIAYTLIKIVSKGIRHYFVGVYHEYPVIFSRMDCKVTRRLAYFVVAFRKRDYFAAVFLGKRIVLSVLSMSQITISSNRLSDLSTLSRCSEAL